MGAERRVRLALRRKISRVALLNSFSLRIIMNRKFLIEKRTLNPVLRLN